MGTKFLMSLNVMDYSFILGIHCKDEESVDEKKEGVWVEGHLFDYDHGGMSYQEEDNDDDAKEEEENELEQSWSDEDGSKKKAKNCVYFGGLIDILQPYNARK